MSKNSDKKGDGFWWEHDHNVPKGWAKGPRRQGTAEQGEGRQPGRMGAGILPARAHAGSQHDGT